MAYSVLTDGLLFPASIWEIMLADTSTARASPRTVIPRVSLPVAGAPRSGAMPVLPLLSPPRAGPLSSPGYRGLTACAVPAFALEASLGHLDAW